MQLLRANIFFSDVLEAAGSMLVVSPLADVEDEALCPRPRPYVPSSVVIKEHEHEHVLQ